MSLFPQVISVALLGVTLSAGPLQAENSPATPLPAAPLLLAPAGQAKVVPDHPGKKDAVPTAQQPVWGKGSRCQRDRKLSS